MAAELIGFIDCPVCGFHGVALKQDKKGKATFYADCCGFQGQSRDSKADKILRSTVFSTGQNVVEIEKPTAAAAAIQKPAAEKPQTAVIEPKPKAKTFAEFIG